MWLSKQVEQQDDVKKILLEEYRFALSLATHTDTLLQRRNRNFLTVNTILITASGALFTAGSFLPNVFLAIVIISLLGLIFCVIWYFVQIRHTELIRLIRLQLRSIENRIGAISLYNNINKALYEHETVKFPSISEEFSILYRAKIRASLMEQNLAWILVVFWFVILLISTTVY